MKTGEIHDLISVELLRAIKNNKPFNSAHEGYAVIKEELDELWDEIKNNPKNWKRIQEEAVQVAAMGMRFLMDLENMRRNYP